jgi:hypothetical protein
MRTCANALVLPDPRQSAGAAQNGGESGLDPDPSALAPHDKWQVSPIPSAMIASCFICSSAEALTAGSAQQADG